MNINRVMKRIRLARMELDRASEEMSKEMGIEQPIHEADSDMIEAKARISALESRVSAIEQRTKRGSA